MSEDLFIAAGSTEEQYKTLIPQIKALLEGEPDLVANLANIAAALKERGVPFAFSTGYDVTAILPSYLAGATFVSKPYRIQDVELRIRQLLASAPSGREAA